MQRNESYLCIIDEDLFKIWLRLVTFYQFQQSRYFPDLGRVPVHFYAR